MSSFVTRRSHLLAGLAAALCAAVTAVPGVAAGPVPSVYDHVDPCDVTGNSSHPGVGEVNVGIGVGDPGVVADEDDGRTVDLDILVLLDGVTQAHAETIFATVALPYDEIDIRVVPTYEVVSPGFVNTVALALIEEARNTFPNKRVPAGYDMVEVLTSKDITGTIDQTAGLAYCLGGVRDSRYAFEVSEAGPPPTAPAAGPAVPALGGTGTPPKVTAHEMGHLLGGQHEYASCGENVTPATATSEPCSLMFYDTALIGLHFGTLNGRIVRGYALRYASANDA